MTQYVINEWFWADLGGENGPTAREETFTAMRGLAESPHQLILVHGSPFDRKNWAMCASQHMVNQRLGSAFIRLIRSNLDRCRIIYPHQLVPLPDELAATVKPDDRYLVQACLTVVGSVVVTTDNPLGEILSSRGLPWIDRSALIAQLTH